MSVKTLFMETTKIRPETTAGDLLTLLVSCGASQISMEYAGGKVIGMRFLLNVGGTNRVFLLPARVDPVLAMLKKMGKPADREKAERVAWRQVYRWTQAQLAMIETGMVEAGEVFMPYAEIQPGVTAYQMLCSGKLLEAAKS